MEEETAISECSGLSGSQPATPPGINVDLPRVLVLNAGFQALEIASIRRAVSLVMAGYAEVLEESGEHLRTPNSLYPIPRIIRLGKMVRPRLQKIRLERRNVFKRDGYVRQYCGRPTRDLTLDHVVPKSRGGRSTWDKLVSACRPCNHKKADRSPAVWLDILEVPGGWRNYLRGG